MSQQIITADLPDMTGKTIIVTGANSGLGLQTTMAMAGKGAHVIMACRNSNKAGDAAGEVRNLHPDADLTIETLDLADLNSVAAFADKIKQTTDHIDILINNAGLMALPYAQTAQGFEMQIGTNHLGHFALAGHLLDHVEKAEAGRIVVVASQAHRMGAISLSDLTWKTRKYSRWGAYGQAKLANLMFMLELSRRLEKAGRKAITVGAHPGYASTELQAKGAVMEGASFKEGFMNFGNRLLAQSSAMGAWPSLKAAASPDANSGDYYGPDGMFERAGKPKKVGYTKAAADKEVAAKLWNLSEQLTGVQFGL